MILVNIGPIHCFAIKKLLSTLLVKKTLEPTETYENILVICSIKVLSGIIKT